MKIPNIKEYVVPFIKTHTRHVYTHSWGVFDHRTVDITLRAMSKPTNIRTTESAPSDDKVHVLSPVRLHPPLLSGSGIILHTKIISESYSSDHMHGCPHISYIDTRNECFCYLVGLLVEPVEVLTSLAL